MMSSFSVVLFFGLLIIIMGAALLWGSIRRYRSEVGIQKDKREKTESVGFVINAFHDVTKQLKEKEKELQQLKSLAEQRAENVETYNEDILQCVPSGVITFDRDGKITTFNRSAEEILDMPREQALGSSCRDIFESGDLCDLIRETFEQELPSTRNETAVKRKGEQIWLGFNAVLLRDRHGAALGVILSFSDLTEVKSLQEQIELRERLTALGEMSAGIAHELRNPMAVIAGYLKLLSKKADGTTNKIIQDVGDEIAGMNRIIDDLLTFARPAALNRTEVNVREMLEECLSTLQQTRDSDGRVTTEFHLEDSVIMLDEGLMRQAFANLLSNAFDAMPEGGTLSVEGQVGKDLKLTFRDNGLGIPRDTLKKIFLPFFTTKDKGVGLGLALVHKIILSHGGRIEAESEEGKGTVFSVVLPKG
ncbi:MAG TPA: hypothetical protein DCO77_00705 [Nitrospiraceae bacterium]|nr:hypothetical protein [Nitrospiraceae bacterium]